MKKNSFIKSISTLASGSIIAQIITVIASPLTTRLFTPEELGTYTLIITAVSMFGPIISGRYDLSIVTEKDDYKVFSLIVLSSICTVVFSILVTIGYIIYFLISHQFDLFSIFVIFFLLLIAGFTNVLTSFNNRLKEYKLMTSVYVLRTSMQNIFMVIFGLFKTGTIGLLFSQTISQILGIRRQGLSLYKQKDNLKNTSFQSVINVAKKYKKQLLFSTPATFFNSYSYSSINYFIKGLYGSGILGYYSLSYRILGMPLTVISNNVSKVYFEEASVEYNKKGIYKQSFMKTLVLMVILAIPMGLILFFFSPFLFKVFFGETWYQAGVYVQILTPLFMIRFVVSTLSVGLLVSQSQKIELLSQFILIGFSTLCYAISILLNLKVEFYLGTISMFFSITYIFLLGYLYKLSRGG